MGRIILHVDILEILSLAWDHPLVTGGLVLMFTPPLFPVVVFFSPLLISTALCAMALISVGHQIESTREREIAGWNARVVEGDRLSARVVNARSRNRVPGEESWLDWVQGVEPGSAWNNSESTLMEDIKEEGLKVDFRADEGGIEFLEEDFVDRQIEAFREYERSFSFRTGGRTAAAPVAASNSFALPGVASTEMVPFPTEGNNKGVSAPQIPAIFLYNLRTGGTGTAANFNGGAGAFPSGPQVATAAANINGGAGALPSSPQVATAAANFNGGAGAFPSGPQIATAAANFNGGAGAFPSGPQVATGAANFNGGAGAFPSGPQVATGAANFNSGAGAPPSGPQIATATATFSDRAGALRSGPQLAAAAASGAHNEAAAELLPFGSFNMAGIIDAVERARDDQRDPEPQRRSMFEKDRNATAAAETQVSPAAALINMNNVPEKNVSLQSKIKPDHSLEGEFVGFTTTAFAGNDSPKSLLVPQIPVMTSSGVVPAVKPSEQSLKARTYNATLRMGNAVIYNASSESGAAGALDRQGPGVIQNKQSANREGRASTPSRRFLAREKSSKHPYQLDIRTSDKWNQMKSPSHSDR